MSDQEINIAIAEACGWRYEKTEEGGKIIYPNGFVCEFTPFSWALEKFYKIIPNFCDDLNAMHEVEKTLSEEQWENYNFILCNLVGGYSKTNKEAIHASSRQKAEAFLETIKK